MWPINVIDSHTWIFHTKNHKEVNHDTLNPNLWTGWRRCQNILLNKPIEFDRQLIYKDDILDNDSTSEPELNVKYKYVLVGTATSSIYVAENLDNAIRIVEKLKPRTDSILFLFNTEGICIRQIVRDKDNNIHLYTPHESFHGVEVQDEHIAGLLKSLNEKH